MSATDRYEECLLNTCVIRARPYYSGLTLANCGEAQDFLDYVVGWLTRDTLFHNLEPMLADARSSLLQRAKL